MIELRWYQQEAVNSVFNFFYENKEGHPLVIMPTGTGKGLTIAELIRRIIQTWPTQRIMLLTHSKELVRQDEEEILALWPAAPVGVFSAGLKRKEATLPITVGGVKSVANVIEYWDKVDLLFVDEAHMISPKAATTYKRVIAILTQKNPRLRVIGFTATGYRMGQGKLIEEGGLFTHECYNIADIKGFERLLSEKHLSPLIPKRTKERLDVGNVGIQNGDFVKGALEAAVNVDDVNERAIYETLELAEHRRHWLLFASGTSHADNIAAIINRYGINCAAVHTKKPIEYNNEMIAAFRKGELRALVNMNMLTIGFNYRPIDFIGMYRPTLSTSLWVQMLGRGTRSSEETGKTDCLVADFAQNAQRLGPIDDPCVPNPKKKGKGSLPVKECEVCNTWNHPRVLYCTCCGSEFEISNEKLQDTAGTTALMVNGVPQYETFTVNQILYDRYSKPGKSTTLKVSYQCGMQMFQEWIAFENPAAAFRTKDWFRQRSNVEPVPRTVDEILALTPYFREPKQITVHVNKRYPEIISYVY